MDTAERDRFNAWAPSYDDSWVQRIFAPLHRATLAYAAVLQPSPRRVLDVGCGTGALLGAAAVRFAGARLLGVDPALGMVRRAAGRVPAGAGLACADASRLPLPDGSVDLIISTMSFNFWPRDAGVREVSRVLAPGGHLVIADLFAVGWLRPVAPVLTAGQRARGRREMEALLRGAVLVVAGWRTVWRGGPLPVLRAVAGAKPVAADGNQQPGG